ncbi:FAD-dependent oxidoreductase [Nocardioides sp.]|uniref:FAD-dependent oxidoreductase n=1 Tax=Nocardioides sp. TaxID=35761 RepID=UPI00261ECA6B|nr:FAD-dependent oxidoreductase [Nocardioides sp.]
MTSKVVVVGGGVVGAATAWQLARLGAEVVLVEQFAPGHDRGSSHGSSRIFRLAYPEADYVALASRALELWRSLESAAGADVLTLTGGVDHGPVEVTSALEATLSAAGHRSERLSPSEAARRWPGLRFDTSVLVHPDAGRVDADAAVQALYAASATLGVEIRTHTRVERISPSLDHVLVTLSGLTTITADRVVVAAGGWLPTLFGDLFPAAPPVRVTQEQPIHLAAATPLAWPSFIHHEGAALPTGTGVYGLGAPEGVKIGHHGIGPVVDPDHRDRSVDPARVEALVDYARTWLPGVDTHTVTASTCLYSTTPSSDFVIDAEGPVVLASACSGHGFKHAPAVGELAAQVALGLASAPERFRFSSVPSVR